MTIGIYRIINSKTNASYIGSSICIEQRLRSHKQKLLKGIHDNIKLQADFNLYGKEAFDVEILEVINTDDVDYDRNLLYIREDYFIDLYKSKEIGYNIADAKFGNTIQYHPNKEEIIKKREITRAEWWKNLPEEERQQIIEKNYKGSNNPNYNNNIEHYCKKCGEHLSYTTIHRRRTICGKCRDRSGKNNPFYGKKLSKEHIEKLRNLNKGRPSARRKRFIAGGIEFPSDKHVAEYYQIDRSLVNYRIKSNKYPDWYCLD